MKLKLKREMLITYSINNIDDENKEKYKTKAIIKFHSNGIQRDAIITLCFPDGEKDFIEWIEEIKLQKHDTVDNAMVFLIQCEKKAIELLRKHYPNKYVYLHGIETHDSR